MKANQSSLQWVKDRVIESGSEQWARPLWRKLTGKQLCPFDLELTKVISEVLKPNSVCIDIGAHKGTVLDLLMRFAPQGTFHAFEPIPYLATLLRRKYRVNKRVTVHEFALSDESGSTSFYIDTTCMGYSGLNTPASRGGNQVETCTVKLARLDDLLPDAQPDMIKIDVEG